MSDLIERQASIDLWEKYHPIIAVDAMQYDAELRQLPSAQPEIIFCKDCIKYHPEKCRCESDITDILGYGRRWEKDDFCSQGIRRETDG